MEKETNLLKEVIEEEPKNLCDWCGVDFNKGEQCNDLVHYTNR